MIKNNQNGSLLAPSQSVQDTDAMAEQNVCVNADANQQVSNFKNDEKMQTKEHFFVDDYIKVIICKEIIEIEGYISMRDLVALPTCKKKGIDSAWNFLDSMDTGDSHLKSKTVPIPPLNNAVKIRMVLPKGFDASQYLSVDLFKAFESWFLAPMGDILNIW